MHATIQAVENISRIPRKTMEIEAKFRLVNPETASIQPFKRVIEGCGFQVVCQDAPIRIVDTYYDNAQHELRTSGAAIRVREKGEKTLLTYKRKVSQEGALHSRVELEAEPRSEHLRAVFSELRDLGFTAADEGVLDLWDGQIEELLTALALIPMVEIMTARLRCEVSEGHHPIALFVLDQVDFERDGCRGGYVGIEIEAIGERNTAGVLTISDAIKAELGESIQEQELSKYEYALGGLQ